MSVANPNWLAVVGLVYAGVGVVLLSTALVSATRLAGGAAAIRASAAPQLGAFGGFGAVLAGAGFFLQSVAQFVILPAGSPVVLMLAGLMALLAMFAGALLYPPAARVADADQTARPSVQSHPPQVTVTISEPAAPAAAPAAVKLVSSAG